ncbi:deoxyribodipyrimidine photo-lyase [Bradyrhizobium prioriisuperbiae]|uniref:cryptochrome/photolyase family protein n=1 Tax=Bradyrhizobium prioriisuperbiae TaxID=2854389 RepID=UPI0028EF1A51|nr:deoxyribodipyrimidine photo-lyase [Bradyrhizobium prioritasuperba]
MISPSVKPVLVWFRDDLRLSDHPALAAAAARGAPLICLYVLDEESATLRVPQARPLGGAARWWLAQSLRALAQSLAAHGLQLVLRKGAAAKVVAEVAREADVSDVAWNEIDIPAHAQVAGDVAREIERAGLAWTSFRGDVLVGPANLRNKEGCGLKVFTPFWNRVRGLGDPPKPLPAPRELRPGPALGDDLETTLARWGLLPTRPDWAGGLRATWTPGEAAAQRRLGDFLDGAIAGYSNGRDRPDHDATSRLSPHLRFGEISPRQVWYAARFAAAERPAIAPDIDKFLSELGWREFCRHLLYDYPDLTERNLQPSFDAFPWRHDERGLAAWQRGRTGYPIVDAGMRELWHTGVMHNRVRMVAASFLIKHLLIDWREGECWFWDTLVDADPGSNPANWQWVAGSGADAAPYFRIFNPVLQGEKFDPDGAYVAKWVPELAKLPPKFIHQPWAAMPIELASAGVMLGQTYPEPIVDHAAARARALAAYAKTRG